MKKRNGGAVPLNERPDEPISSMKRYMTEISAGKVKSKVEEMSSTKEQLVLDNLRFVVMLAHQWRSPSISLGDLIQEGNLGIMKAAEKFDPSRGLKFITYARHYIIKYLRKAVHRNCPVKSGYGKVFVVSLNDPLFGRESGSGCCELESRIADDVMPPPDFELMDAEDREFIMNAVDRNLTAKESALVKLRYGLDGGSPMLLRELAKIYGCSYQMINVRVVKANAKLRRIMEKNHLNRRR